LERLEQQASGPIFMPEVEAPAAGVAAATTQSTSPASAPSAGPSTRWSLAAALFALWVFGVVVMASVILVDMLKLKLLDRRGTKVSDGLQVVANAIAQDIGLKRTPRLRVIAGLDSPALV